MGHQRKRKRRSQAINPDIELYVSRVKRAIATGTARETDIEKGGKGGLGETESVVQEGDDGDGEKETVVDGGDESERESLADVDSERESDVEGDTEMKELNEEEQCIMCRLTEEDDEEDEVWIECTKCLKWVHESCLPPYHPHDTDDDFFVSRLHYKEA